MALLGKLIVNIDADLDGLRKQIRAAESVMRQSAKTLGGLSSQLSTSISLPLAAIGVGAIKSAADMERLNSALSTTMEAAGRSSEAATKELEALRQAALAPGLDFEQAVKGSVRLQNVGFSAEKARGILVQLANAVAITGGQAQELDGVTRQFGQMIAKGRILQEDLTIIQENMPAVAVAMEKAFGTKSAEQLRKMGISAEQFVDGVTKALSELPRVSGGLANSIVNAFSAVKLAAAQVGEVLNKQFGISDKLNEFAVFLGELAQGFQDLDSGTQTAILAVAAFALALGPAIKAGSLMVNAVLGTTNAIRGAIQFYHSLSVATESLTARQAILNTVMKANVIGALIGVALALGAAYLLLRENTDAAAQAQKAVAEVNKQATESVAAQRLETGLLVETLKSETASREEKAAALAKLNQISPEYFKGLNAEKLEVDQLNVSYKEYIESLLRAARAKGASEKIVAKEARLSGITEEKAKLQGSQAGIEAAASAVPGFAAAGVEIFLAPANKARLEDLSKEEEAIRAEIKALNDLFKINSALTSAKAADVKAELEAADRAKAAEENLAKLKSKSAEISERKKKLEEAQLAGTTTASQLAGGSFVGATGLRESQHEQSLKAVNKEAAAIAAQIKAAEELSRTTAVLTEAQKNAAKENAAAAAKAAAAESAAAAASAKRLEQGKAAQEAAVKRAEVYREALRDVQDEINEANLLKLDPETAFDEKVKAVESGLAKLLDEGFPKTSKEVQHFVDLMQLVEFPDFGKDGSLSVDAFLQKLRDARKELEKLGFAQPLAPLAQLTPDAPVSQTAGVAPASPIQPVPVEVLDSYARLPEYLQVWQDKVNEAQLTMDTFWAENGAAMQLASEAMVEFGSTIENSLADANTSWADFGQAAKQAIVGVIANLIKLAVANAVTKSFASSPNPLLGAALAAIAGGLAAGLFKRLVGSAKFATGTLSAPGGRALVGEDGPELLNLPSSSGLRIPAKQTAAVLGALDRAAGQVRNVQQAAQNGLTVVGQNGPEYVNLPAGAQVIPAPQTREVLQSLSRTVTDLSSRTTNTVRSTINRDIAERIRRGLAVPAYAVGTLGAKGGRSLVGERGAELVNLPNLSGLKLPTLQAQKVMEAVSRQFSESRTNKAYSTVSDTVRNSLSNSAANTSARSVSEAVRNLVTNSQVSRTTSDISNTVRNSVANSRVSNATSTLSEAVRNSQIFNRFNIPQFAAGTLSAPGGLSLVGEFGPELVNLARGAQVLPSLQTERVIETLQSGGGTQQVQVGGTFRIVGTDLVVVLEAATRKANRVR